MASNARDPLRASRWPACSRSWRGCATPARLSVGHRPEPGPSRHTPSRKPRGRRRDRPRRPAGAQGGAGRPPVAGRLPLPDGERGRRLRASPRWPPAVADKMVERHLVFGDATVDTAEAQTVSWEAPRRPSGQPRARARPAPWTGWRVPSPPCCGPRRSRAGGPGRLRLEGDGPVIDKIEEELGELRAELAAGTVDQARLTDELGDVLFAVANLARHCKVDPEAPCAYQRQVRTPLRHIESAWPRPGRSPPTPRSRRWKRSGRRRRRGLN